jgi:hypothetical protein
MERGHVIQLVPARIPAGIIPHAVTAPAMVDIKFIDVEPPVTYAAFFKYLLDQVDHVPGIIRPVIAAINQEDVELFTIVFQNFLLCQF